MPIEGVGLGYRTEHHDAIICQKPAVPWFEVLADNYLKQRGKTFDQLLELCSYYPVVQHSVGMSIGSVDPLNEDYLKKIKALADEIKPAWISDHLAWVSVKQEYLHDLMPLPFNESVINHVVDRIDAVQNFLGRQILIENISSYLTFTVSDMTEWDFLNTIALKADCYLLLDINNIFVNATNHGFDPLHYIRSVDKSRVKQYHLGGHADKNTYLLDTHGARICDAVGSLYEFAVKTLGDVPAAIEWDYDIPPFAVLIDEMERAKAHQWKS